MVQVLPDERGESTASFLRAVVAQFTELGIRVQRILTDRGMAYTHSRAFALAAAQLGIFHRCTRPYRPHTNGKAERLIRTLLNEWAYAHPYLSNQARLSLLPRWLAFYNGHRPHTGLGGRSPLAAVNKGQENYT